MRPANPDTCFSPAARSCAGTCTKLTELDLTVGVSSASTTKGAGQGSEYDGIYTGWAERTRQIINLFKIVINTINNQNRTM